MNMARLFGAATVALFMIGVAAIHALNGSAKADGYEMTVVASEAAARTVRSQYLRVSQQSANDAAN